MDRASLVLSLMQQTCVYLVVAYLLSRMRFFAPLTHLTIRPFFRLIAFLVFSTFCVMGTYLGLEVGGAIANTRAIGAILGGILGGPWVGFAVGLTGGIHRYFLGGPSALVCALSTVAEGLVAGGLNYYYLRTGRGEKLLSPWLVGFIALVMEFLQMTLLILVYPRPESVAVVDQVAIPMILANSLGTAFFMLILLDRRQILENASNLYSSKALKIAAQTDGILHNGFNQETAKQIAQIILNETGVGAVAFTDRERVLAFVGAGSDHHLVGSPIAADHTKIAIAEERIVFADGNEIPYQCPLDPRCPLGMSLVVPLRDEKEYVIGTFKMYELRSRPFSTINKSLGEGIGRLLSSQILEGNYEIQKELLAQTEIKLLHAQVNPHFLFNTLNTLSAVIRHDPEKARQLVQNLSVFFRKNLQKPNEVVSLSDEIDHVNAYLQIELARFSNRLSVVFDIADELLQASLPAFSLQPIVENAIKHGTSQLLGEGRVKISARENDLDLVITIEDNAGLYKQPYSNKGFGMNLVDQRIKKRYGESYGLFVKCDTGVSTRVEMRVPFERHLAS
jgi:two-component system LytT family sensor kinase